MDDTAFMHIFHCLANLLDYVFDLSLRQPISLLFYGLVKVITKTGLEKKIDVLRINVKMIKLDNIWMVEK